MKQQIITFESPITMEPKTNLFVQYSHMDLSKKRHQKMLDQAVAMYPEICKNVHLQAVVATADNIRVNGDTLCLDGIALHSPAFLQLQPDTVQQAYPYFLTIGNCLPRDGAGLVEILIVDTWGTILVDLAREMLEKHLQSRLDQSSTPLYLSPSYGIGFYDITRDQVQQLKQLADPAAIGMEVLDNALILPQKSCAGIYLAATTADGFPKA